MGVMTKLLFVGVCLVLLLADEVEGKGNKKVCTGQGQCTQGKKCCVSKNGKPAKCKKLQIKNKPCLESNEGVTGIMETYCSCVDGYKCVAGKCKEVCYNNGDCGSGQCCVFSMIIKRSSGAPAGQCMDIGAMGDACFVGDNAKYYHDILVGSNGACPCDEGLECMGSGDGADGMCRKPCSCNTECHSNTEKCDVAKGYCVPKSSCG